jgi:hypothetical protein
MSEHENSAEQPQGSPLTAVLAVVIGTALGSSVYFVAEARHSKQMAEHAAHLMPLPAAAPEPSKAEPVAAAKPAEPEAKPAAEDSAAEEKPAEPEDPKARALAARTAAEQALLDEARAQLAADNATAALGTLDRMKKRFARGTLVQERELLRIEAYKARGQMPAAKRAARKFVKAYPESPHLGELEELTKI